MREPKFSFVEGIGVWEFAGSSRCGPTTVTFSHATGFHGRCWDGIVARLPGDWRVLSLDMRGHGRSVKPAGPVLWKDFGRDLARVCERLEIRGAIGVGHSMGGHATAYAAALRPAGTFGGLVLIDPVIRPSERYGKPWFEDHYARKRRNVWVSSDEMYERYRARAPFDKWDPPMLRDYCLYALRGNQLACEPEYEATIYEQSSQSVSDIGDELWKIDCPVVVMRSYIDPGPGAVPDMNWSPCDPLLFERLPRGEDRKVPYGHFIPMEAPDLVAAEIEGIARKLKG